MSTIKRIGPKLFLCGTIGGLCLIGWATRYSIAQSGIQDVPPPAAPAEGTKAALPQAPAESIKPDVVAPASLGPVPLGAEDLEPARLKDLPSPEPLPSPTTASAPAPVVVGPDHAPIEAEDPEKVASEFLEQNQKLAEAQLKALKEEAQKLRARLSKVEAGIKRWDRMLVALNQSAGAATVEPAADERPASKKDANKLLPPGTVHEEPSPAGAEPESKESRTPNPAAAGNKLVPVPR